MAINGLDHERSSLVLYGTETGTSQDIAEEVARCLERLRFTTDVAEIDALSYPQLASYTITVFAVSTTGQGDFPANARNFWTTLLRRKLGPTTLRGVVFALVGLGDSSYPKFNWAARKLEKRLKQLGAIEVHESCEADEQGDEGTDGAFLAWLQTFRSTMLTRFPLPTGVSPVPENLPLPSKWRLDLASTDARHENGLGDVAKVLDNEAFPATLAQIDRVTPTSHWQDVRLLKLRTSRDTDYMPGDSLAIFPRNMPQDVETLVERMKWSKIADVPLKFTSQRNSSRPSLFDTPPIVSTAALTLRVVLTETLDINAIPRRSFFGAIAQYTSDEMHKERLLEFTDPQYLDEYYDYATRPRRSILEILQEFDSVKLPWQEVTNIFPKLRPRQFSIASGGALKRDGEGTMFDLLVAIVKYKTVIKRIREGVCTRYLAQLPVGATLNVVLKTEGRFATRQEIAGRNHVLIGGGTGIAPLRAVIHEKALQSNVSAATILVFGARNADADYFFKDEWDHTSPQSVALPNLEVITAFSRDQNQKIYVQDRIRQHGRELANLLRDEKTTIIVCGASGQMPKAVRQALIDALVANPPQQEGSAAAEGAEQFLARLEKQGRYKQETWS